MTTTGQSITLTRDAREPPATPVAAAVLRVTGVGKALHRGEPRGHRQRGHRAAHLPSRGDRRRRRLDGSRRRQLHPSVLGALHCGRGPRRLIYAALGALAGAPLDKLAATYFLLSLALTDLGISQNPMVGTGAARSWATVLPGYGPGRMLLDGAFSPGFHAAAPLAIALGWTVAPTLTVGFVLRRAVGTRT